MIAEGLARLARDDCLESTTLSVVRSLVDHHLALAVSLRNLAGEFADQRPIQARERRVVEMPFDDAADVGELTIAMCRRLVELTAAAHRTIAVVVGMALEFPLVRHLLTSKGHRCDSAEYMNDHCWPRYATIPPLMVIGWIRSGRQDSRWMVDVL